MNEDRRGGFTLVELLVAGVAGIVLLSGVFQILLTNQRIYVARGMETRGRQTQLAGADLLFAELRELSPGGQDLVAMGNTWLTVRAQRRFGLACAADNATGNLRVTRVGDWFEVGDSVFVFADGEEGSAVDDTWHLGRVTAVDTTVFCGARRAQNLSVPAIAPLMAIDSVRPGAPVRSFERYTYSLTQDQGEWYLARQVYGDSPSPLAGPVLPPSEPGLSFAYLDSTGVATTIPADVAQIEVTLKTGGAMRNANGRVVRDSLQTVISLRN